MAKANRRQVVLGDLFWEKLQKMKREEQRSISELVREALIDLFEKRSRQNRTTYDPVADTFKASSSDPQPQR